MADEKKKLTVFKTDRHEDIAACVASALVVAIVLGYMAFIVPVVNVKAAVDGKVTEIVVQKDAVVKKGDKLYTMEVVKKKWTNNVMEEKTVTEEVLAKANGKVVDVKAKAGDAVKKGKTVILELDHEKGTLP